MTCQWHAAIVAALLVAVGCDKTTDPLSPADEQSFAAGGNDQVQSVSGHAVVTAGGFNIDYTFNAEVKNGVVSGHITVFTNNGGPIFSIEGDVDCLIIVPGTNHARMSAIVTRRDGIEAEELYWNVTDGGIGAKGLPDAASPINGRSVPGPFCATELAEQTNAANFIRVKP